MTQVLANLSIEAAGLERQLTNIFQTAIAIAISLTVVFIFIVYTTTRWVCLRDMI